MEGAQAVRAAADALGKACFVHELAIERYSRFHVKGKATLVRVRKLHEKPGGRAVSWTQGWLAKLNELGEEETELDEEIQLRADEVVDCERKLARQQERVAEMMVEARAWLEYDYEKTLAFVHNKEPQSDGSSPGSDSDSDSHSDEQLTLDEMMERNVFEMQHPGWRVEKKMNVREVISYILCIVSE